MIINNERTEAQLVLRKGSLKQTHFPSASVVAVVINIHSVAFMMNILWKHAVPLNFEPRTRYQYYLR